MFMALMTGVGLCVSALIGIVGATFAGAFVGCCFAADPTSTSTINAAATCVADGLETFITAVLSPLGAAIDLVIGAAGWHSALGAAKWYLALIAFSMDCAMHIALLFIAPWVMFGVVIPTTFVSACIRGRYAD